MVDSLGTKKVQILFHFKKGKKAFVELNLIYST